MMKFGWNPSSGPLNVDKFQVSNTVKALGITAPGATASSYPYTIQNTVPILDQGNLDSCVANATCAAFSILKNLSDGYVHLYSRLFLYWNARLNNGQTATDAGCYVHLALGSLIDKGICEETIWPYVEAEVLKQPDILAYKQGDDNTLTTFYQIVSQGNDRLNEIEAAIRANHPVIFGTYVGQDFQDYKGAATVFDYPSTSIGAHGLVAVGVRLNSSGNREWLIRNSWGESWGANGLCWFSSDYMTNTGTADIFVPTMMPDLLL